MKNEGEKTILFPQIPRMRAGNGIQWCAKAWVGSEPKSQPDTDRTTMELGDPRVGGQCLLLSPPFMPHPIRKLLGGTGIEAERRPW